MLWLALLILGLALLLLWMAKQQRQKAGLPGGRIIYSDTSQWGSLEKPLFAAELGLTGKPDYLVKKGDQYIPVEVKSGTTPAAPYDAHIFQLGAYCLLTWETYGVRPDYGILHYHGRTFAIDFTSELENKVRQRITDIQMGSRRKELPRSHEAPQRCARCGFRSICDQSIR